MVFRLKRARIIPYTDRPHTPIHPRANTHTHTHTHTRTHARTHARTRTNKPLQPFAPSLSYPVGQSPHDMDPTVLMHLRLLSQPPLFVAHSFTSKHVRELVCVYIIVHNNSNFHPTSSRMHSNNIVETETRTKHSLD